MTDEDIFNLLTPRLRRYARALSQAAPGPSEAADELVHATLLRVLHSSERIFDTTLSAFAVLTELHRDSLVHRRTRSTGTAQTVEFRPPARPGRSDPRSAHDKVLMEGIASLKLDEREALLLVAVEQFTYAEAMQILHVSRAGLIARLSRARARLTEALAEPPPAETIADHLDTKRTSASATVGKTDAKKAPHLRLVK